MYSPYVRIDDILADTQRGVVVIRGGFWRRALALLIDLLIVFTPWYLIILLIANLLDTRRLWDDQMERWFQVVWFIPWLLYSGMEITNAGTWGKTMLGLRIVRADGAPADRWRLTMRYLGKQYPIVLNVLYAITENPLVYYLAGLALLIVGIGCLYALGDEKRAWHDEWAGTAVALRRPQSAGFPIEPRQNATS